MLGGGGSSTGTLWYCVLTCSTLCRVLAVQVLFVLLTSFVRSSPVMSVFTVPIPRNFACLISQDFRKCYGSYTIHQSRNPPKTSGTGPCVSHCGGPQSHWPSCLEVPGHPRLRDGSRISHHGGPVCSGSCTSCLMLRLMQFLTSFLSNSAIVAAINFVEVHCTLYIVHVHVYVSCQQTAYTAGLGEIEEEIKLIDAVCSDLSCTSK